MKPLNLPKMLQRSKLRIHRIFFAITVISTMKNDPIRNWCMKAITNFVEQRTLINHIRRTIYKSRRNGRQVIFLIFKHKISLQIRKDLTRSIILLTSFFFLESITFGLFIIISGVKVSESGH